eukprot:CAMPEP_0172317014 /NCGR_PEP_ID=MMETSP1058-20130122/30268_1 /TAXON_ID=83371 /ORGANISM="Detonula confervacea, Strain CCMP 353" /LENGTH=578 /DNA_ID=CAMNT_0013031465 /DNA_START=98 /DNA_END=1834 /DNA_ORIENTATION=+
MASANKLRSASFLSLLVLFCVVTLFESSFAAAAEIDDGGDGGDIILDDVEAVDAIDANIGSNVQAPLVDQHDDEIPSSPTATQSSDEECDSQKVNLLDGETSSSSGSSNTNYDESNGGNKPLQYTPPTHFQITAHVQTNLHTGYSYFLPSESSLPASFAHLPFLECGAVGSTTESLPLVSGVFRHVPHTAVVPKRDDIIDVVLENLEQGIMEKEDDLQQEEGNNLDGLDMLNEEDSKSNETNHDTASSESIYDSDDHPKRPSPPKYVVALSSMEITVGGNGNETQKFNAGDVIFIEDTWWGVWDDEDESESVDDIGHADETNEGYSSDETRDVKNDETKLKGYIMRANSESQADLNVLMLTVPNAIHRHWKNAQYAMATARREEQREAKQQQQQLSSSRPTLNENTNEFGIRRPWWKQPKTFLQHGSQQQQAFVPKPCSLEFDPAFARPSAVSSTTLSEHFSQHFTSLLRLSSNPHPSFLPHHHQDLILPILAQTSAAMVGGATALALVLQLWRVIPGPIAVGFGSACLIAFGTWGFVWLGEEILDQWELWRERRRLERMMSEGWGRGGSMMMGDAQE